MATRAEDDVVVVAGTGRLGCWEALVTIMECLLCIFIFILYLLYIGFWSCVVYYMVSIMYSPITIYIYITWEEGCIQFIKHVFSLKLQLGIRAIYFSSKTSTSPSLPSVSFLYSIYNQHSSIMDLTASQSAPPLTANTQTTLPANSPILQSASGFSMAPPPGFFALSHPTSRHP